MSVEPQIHHFDNLTSTNAAIATDAADLPHGAVYVTANQTAGRGQRGNTWEAEPGRNLTFSILLRPATIRPSEAFVISMLTSISIADVLQEFMPQTKVEIKWPNDIYIADKKLCGILIENAFSGSAIETSIVGIGINVNQSQFLSDAPNPVSMLNITGATFDLGTILDKICRRIIRDFDQYEANPDITTLTATYRSRQWRGIGVYQWHDLITDEIISASILHIAPDGHLTLNTIPRRTYAFKQIAALI